MQFSNRTITSGLTNGQSKTGVVNMSTPLKLPGHKIHGSVFYMYCHVAQLNQFNSLYHDLD